MTVSNENAYTYIRELTQLVHEGFHGTAYEMTEALYEVDASLFTGEFDGDNDEDVDSPWEFYENRRIMESLYNRVTYAMICLIIDHTSRVVDNSTQSLRLRSSMQGVPDAIVTCILDDLCAGMSAIDETATSPYTREFFEQNR